MRKIKSRRGEGGQNVGQVLTLAKAEKENLKPGTVFLGGVTLNMTGTQKNNPTVLVAETNYHRFNTTRTYYLKVLDARSLK